jgi:uncharacterized membrane protein (DUF485 family)
MPTYYELLGISTSATTAEIVSACERQYRYWQQQAASKNPQAIARANDTLRQLEQIRATLTDSRKRAQYDASIETVSGLADPLARFSKATPPRPSVPLPSPAPVAKEEEVVVTPWTCPKCNNLNPETSNFCYMCGAQILRECPECRTLTSSIVTGFCNKCGLQYNAAARRVEIVGILQRIEQEIAALGQKIPPIKQRKDDSVIFFKLFFFVLLLCCPICWMSTQANTPTLMTIVIVFGVLVPVCAFFMLVIGLIQHQQFKTKQNADLRQLDQEISSRTDRQNVLQQEYMQLGKKVA